MADALGKYGDAAGAGNEMPPFLVETVDTKMQQVHEGKLFSHCNLHLALANNGIHYHLIRVGAKDCHIEIAKLSTEGSPFHFFGFEGPTVTNVGTLAPAGNNNRNSLITPVTQIYEGPTISAEGTELMSSILPGTGSSGGSSEITDHEWILKANTDYLIKLVNKSSGARDFSLAISWVEF